MDEKGTQLVANNLVHGIHIIQDKKFKEMVPSRPKINLVGRLIRILLLDWIHTQVLQEHG